MSKAKTATVSEPTVKPAGRPAGAETKERTIVTAVIVVDKCPKCGCDKPPKNKRLLREGIASSTVKGQQVGSYKHFTANCAECDQAFLYREYKAI
jgi:predicted nucleic-acid-binding Zn-ribbon protein